MEEPTRGDVIMKISEGKKGNKGGELKRQKDGEIKNLKIK